MFFAVLVASLALAVGLAIYSLTSRELELSSVAAQSLYAVYAADAGEGCALYWDAHYGSGSSAFATSSTSVVPSSGVSCESQDIAAAAVAAHTWPNSSTATAATTTFSVQFAGQPYCALVTVAKFVDTITAPGNTIPRTVIVSDGFNTCGTSQARVERELKASY